MEDTEVFRETFLLLRVFLKFCYIFQITLDAYKAIDFFKILKKTSVCTRYLPWIMISQRNMWNQFFKRENRLKDVIDLNNATGDVEQQFMKGTQIKI